MDNQILEQPISQNGPNPIYTGPLTELREQIEAVHDQIIKPKHSAQDVLNSLQHDLRTPIGNILACVTLIHMDGELTESQMELIDIVEEAAKTLVSKLDHILTINQ